MACGFSPVAATALADIQTVVAKEIVAKTWVFTGAPRALYESDDLDGPPIAPPTSETLLFELEWGGSDFNNHGSVNQNAEGGYWDNEGSQMTPVVTSGDVLHPGIMGYSNEYGPGLGGTAEHVIDIYFPDQLKVYWECRVKFRGISGGAANDWVFGSDQLKWCKLRGNTESNHVTCNQFFSGSSGQFRFSQDNNVFVLAETGDGRQDDIINNFGGPGVDENWSPDLDTWYTIACEADIGTVGVPSAGSARMWVVRDDAAQPVAEHLYIQKNSAILSQNGDDMIFNKMEFGGHVWQAGDPGSLIYLEFQSVKVYTGYPY